MHTNVIRRMATTVAAGTLATVAAVPTAGDAFASSAPSTTASTIVPPPGSGTAYGYSAVIRHPSGPTDDRGKLVLLAPDGRSKTIGDVSDGADITDVSSNARTVVTAFWIEKQLRLTIWDTATGKATYLRVDGGADAVLVKDGVVVPRWSGGARLYSRSGTLLRTYAETGDSSVMASADGTRIAQGAGSKGMVVRTVASGQTTRQIPPPSGRNWCFPANQLAASSFSMVCENSDEPTPHKPTAYRAGWTSAVPTARLVDGDKPSGDLWALAGGRFVYNAATGSPGWRPALQDRDGSTSYLEDLPGVDDYTIVSGAYQNTVFVHAPGFGSKPGLTLQRVDVERRTVKTVAGPGSALGGFVTAARTVDGT